MEWFISGFLKPTISHTNMDENAPDFAELIKGKSASTSRQNVKNLVTISFDV